MNKEGYTYKQLCHRKRLKESLRVMDYALNDVHIVVREMMELPEEHQSSKELIMGAVTAFGTVRTNINAIIPDDLMAQLLKQIMEGKIE